MQGCSANVAQSPSTCTSSTFKPAVMARSKDTSVTMLDMVVLKFGLLLKGGAKLLFVLSCSSKSPKYVNPVMSTVAKQVFDIVSARRAAQ